MQTIEPGMPPLKWANLALLARWTAGYPALATLFATVLVLNEILLTVWRQR